MRSAHDFFFPLRNLTHAIYRDFFSNKKKNVDFIGIFFYTFLIFAQNIDYGYTLEPPCQGVPTIYVVEQK